MYYIHRFHLKMDPTLLLAFGKYMARCGISSREGAVNYIFETMEEYIDEITMGFHNESLEDSPLDYIEEGLSEDVILNIRDYNFDKIRFLRFRFKSFSFASILRRILRLFLILKNKEILELLYKFRKLKAVRVWWGVNFEAHMSPLEPTTTMKIYLDYKYRIRNITVHMKKE